MSGSLDKPMLATKLILGVNQTIREWRRQRPES